MPLPRSSPRPFAGIGRRSRHDTEHGPIKERRPRPRPLHSARAGLGEGWAGPRGPSRMPIGPKGWDCSSRSQPAAHRSAEGVGFSASHAPSLVRLVAAREAPPPYPDKPGRAAPTTSGGRSSAGAREAPPLPVAPPPPAPPYRSEEGAGSDRVKATPPLSKPRLLTGASKPRPPAEVPPLPEVRAEGAGLCGAGTNPIGRLLAVTPPLPLGHAPSDLHSSAGVTKGRSSSGVTSRVSSAPQPHSATP